jgi:hypothetical protein
MTLQKAKSIARHLGLTLRQLRSGDYRVNFRDGNESTAYYTDKLEDAVNTAVAMARQRALLAQHRPELGRDLAFWELKVIAEPASRARRAMTAAPNSGSAEQMFGAE